jgi:hypothetical protein
MTARVDEQRRDACLMQRAGQWQHHRRIAAPTVNHDRRRVRRHGTAGGRDEPRVKGSLVGGGNAQSLELKAEVSR